MPIESSLLYYPNTELALGLLLFGIVIAFLILWYSRYQNWPAADVSRLLGITIIVVLAIFVVIVGIGLGESIITAVIGLLGTLGGYLAGASTSDKKE